MRAIRFHSVGGPEVLRLEQVPDPVPGAGELLVRVRAVGVNFADTRFRRGEYFVRPQFPQIPGMESAGEVVALGAGTTGVAVGDRVMVLGGMGAYAELLVCKPRDCYPMPPGLSFEAAAALPVQGLTAHHLLDLAGHLRRGERVLVHAAAGGVGTLAVQLAKRMGASTVIGTASSDAKLALVRELGADVVVDYKREDFAQRTREATEGKGADVILEMLGGTETFKRNLSCLASFGRMVVFGAASGDTRGTIEPVGLMGKNHTVTGYYLTPILKYRELCAPPLEALARDVASGALRVVVGRRASLEEAADVHREMEARATVGKLVLVP
jgi:NADPH2:quinone reductase